MKGIMSNCQSANFYNDGKKSESNKNGSNVEIKKISHMDLSGKKAYTIKSDKAEKTEIYVSNSHISMHNLKLINSAIIENINKNDKIFKQKEASLKHLESVSDIIDEIEEGNKKLSIDDLKTICEKYKELSDNIKKNEFKELVILLSLHMKSIIIKNKISHEYDILKKTYSYLKDPGSSKTKNVTLGLSAGVDLCSLNDTLASFGPSLDISLKASSGVSLAPNDEAMLFKEKNVSGILGLKGVISVDISDTLNIGADFCGEIQYSQTKIEEYNDLDHYLSVNKIEEQDKNLKVKQNKRSFILQKASDSSYRLNELLNSQLGICTDFYTPGPSIKVPNKAIATTISGEVKAKTKLALNTKFNDSLSVNTNLSLDGSYFKSIKTISAFSRESFFNAIESNPGKLHKLPTSLTKHAKNIVKDTQGNTTFNSILTGLNLLESDIEKYYEVVQKYDWQRHSKYRNDSEIKSLRNEKHEIEDRWGVIGRHQFIQFLSASHAYLSGLIIENDKKMICDEEYQNIMSTLDRTRSLIENPKIHHSRERRYDITGFKSRIPLKMSDLSTSFSVSAESVSLKVNILQRDFSHPSRVRNGRYTNISVTGTVSSSFQDVIDSLALNSMIVDAAQQQGISLPADIDIVPDIGAGTTHTRMVCYFEPSYAKGTDFAGLEKWFTRDTQSIFANTSIELSGSIAPGVSIGFSTNIDHQKNKFIREKIGTNNLSYTMTRFNRYYLSAKNSANNKQWDDFFNLHSIEYGTMFKKLTNPDTKIHKESMHFFDELKKKATNEEKTSEIEQFQADFEKSIGDYTKEMNDTNFGKAREQFEYFLSLLVEPWLQEHKSQWEELDISKSLNSALDKKTRLMKKIGVHKR